MWGDKVEGLELTIATGVAPFWTERPLLRAEDEYLWDIFWMLSGTRSIGMAAGPIGVDAIFALLAGIGERSVERKTRIARIVRAMDAVYLECVRDMAESTKTTPPRSTPR